MTASLTVGRHATFGIGFAAESSSYGMTRRLTNDGATSWGTPTEPSKEEMPGGYCRPSLPPWTTTRVFIGDIGCINVALNASSFYLLPADGDLFRMRKRDELTRPESCMSRARDDEWTFVLLGRDAAAPSTVRFWIQERIRRGKNVPGDPQIVEAELWAKVVEQEQHGKQPGPAKHGTPPQVEIFGPDGKVHYRRPINHHDVMEALDTHGYYVACPACDQGRLHSGTNLLQCRHCGYVYHTPAE